MTCKSSCSIQHLGMLHTLQHQQKSDIRISFHHVFAGNTQLAVKMTKKLLQKGNSPRLYF